jgi:ACS family hexuronate transporter-like MFS transporter
MTRYRWVVCALLFFVCTVNYMDRQVLGLLKPDLSRTFGWSETIMLVWGSAYLVAWTLFHLGVPRIKPVEIKSN